MSSLKGTSLMAALGLAMTVGLSAPAAAQGFLDNFFALFKSRPAARPAAPMAPPPDYRQRPPLVTPNWSAEESRPLPRNMPGSGNYRTLCVRMCDGYYWPVNFSASRREFHRDADICKSSCTSEARLFYHPNASGQPADMVDLTGRAYAQLPTAFKYRKKLLPGCRCRPEPWSESERLRHASYAAPETVKRDDDSIAADHPAAEAQPEARTAMAETETRQFSEGTVVAINATEGDGISPSLARDTKATIWTSIAATSLPDGAREPASIRSRERKTAARPAHSRPQPPPVRPRKTQASGLFGFGAPKYRWPGD
jgi:hypothetical protein